MVNKMKDSLFAFPKQFGYEPEVHSQGPVAKFDKFGLFGMGGSGLLADTLLYFKPSLDIVSHKSYGLPNSDLSGRLLIFVSYSGHTEETIDSFKAALSNGHHLAVIATGGELLKLAKKLGILYVQLPQVGLQPRVALGHQLRAVLKLMGEESLYKEVGVIGKALKIAGIAKEGSALAKKIGEKLPVIYASLENQLIAYNWKIRFNETAKIPAFFNVVPEMNHNELNGFDVKKGTKDLSSKMHFFFIEDANDHPKIRKRMTVMQKLYEDNGLSLTKVKLIGKNRIEKFLNGITLADWAAYHTAEVFGSDPDNVPIIEKFKKLI